MMDRDSMEVAGEISPTEQLFIPHRKRLSFRYSLDEQGNRELRIDYGLKEITFDEQRLFAFAEQLVREPSFTGRDATTWGPGYQWDEIQPLLEALVEEGIVQRGDGEPDPRGGGLVASPLPPASCPAARTWSLADSESISRDLAGRAIEVGHLEAVIPSYRIAHSALDADDRQVGEANVFPPGLRLDRDTEWRVCQYAGSRYRDETPMNVTALKAMIKHWKPMLAMLGAVRGELAHRLAIARPQWTIGEVFVLANAVLSLPAFQLMQRGGGSPQPPLHPVLSSLFRVTDGVRMTTYHMQFSVEDACRIDQPITAAALFARAEQHALFIGKTGVCAGPRHMIDEFLAAAIDGAPVEGSDAVELPGELRALLAQLPAALDYGLYGLQASSTSLALWLAMSRTYQALLAALEAARADLGEAGVRLLARLRADWRQLEGLQIALDHDREVHWRAYESAYELAWRALREPLGPPRLADAVARRPASEQHCSASDRLRRRAMRLARPDTDHAAIIGPIVDRLVDYLRDEQAALAATTAILDAINQLLDRPRPRRPLGARDLHAFYVIGGGRFPYLLDSIADELGIHIECTADAIDIAGE